MDSREIVSVIAFLIVAAVIRYVAGNAKKWVTPSGKTLEEQMKKRDERMAQAARRPVPPPPDFPDAACVVCDNTGEDHFVHDKAQRIAQLEDFLKNGIIDKAEYRTMRDRYERGL